MISMVPNPQNTHALGPGTNPFFSRLLNGHHKTIAHIDHASSVQFTFDSAMGGMIAGGIVKSQILGMLANFSVGQAHELYN